MKFYIHTLGCKVNLYESEALAAMLINHSYTQVENETEADVIIVNTCTVTSTSDSKSKKIIRSLRKTNNKAILVAMGCYAQLNKDELSSLGVDIAVGNNNRSKIYELINEFQKVLKKLDEISSREKLLIDLVKQLYSDLSFSP